MSLTHAAVKRFWDSMGERFGKRWLDDYGGTPTRAWRDVLDQYTPDVIAAALAALKDRPERVRSTPPTLAEFETLLAGAARHSPAAGGADYCRSYWRAIVVSNLERALCKDRAVISPADLQRYIARHGAVYGNLRILLDELCDLEAKNQGQRTLGMYQLCLERCKSAVSVDLQQPTLSLGA